MKISAVDLVLRVSAKSIGASEVPVGSNAGPYVERVLGVTKLGKGYPWCAAEVADTGVIALGALWPLPRTASCHALYEWAHKEGAIEAKPERGDVFLVWYPSLGRFAHTGFVSEVGEPCFTHEGNTSSGKAKGSREGWLKAEKRRVFSPRDRFIRWTRLLPAGFAA